MQHGQLIGSECHTLRIKSRHFLEGTRLADGGGMRIIRRPGAEAGWRLEVGQCGRLALPLAAHLVAVPAIVPHHLAPFIWDVVGDPGQEVSSGEDLEVAMDFGVEARPVDDGVTRGFDRHFLDRKRIAQDVLGQVFQIALGLKFDPLAGMEVETGVLPGAEDLDAGGG